MKHKTKPYSLLFNATIRWAFLFLLLFSNNFIFGQACSSTWNLYSSNAPVISGSITGSNPVSFGSGLTSTGTLDPTYGSYAQGWSSSATIPVPATETRYIQFSVTPTGSCALNITSINFWSYNNEPFPSDYQAVFWSTSPTFATSTAIVTNYSTWNGYVNYANGAIAAACAAGQTIYFRVYFYWASAGDWYGIYSMQLSGTTSCCTAPAITTQPANASACNGGTAALSVAASGTGPLTYQWQSMASNCATPTNVGTNSPNYTTAALSTGTYYYRCVVTNACGTVNSNCSVVTVTAASTAGTIAVSATGYTPTTVTNPNDYIKVCPGTVVTITRTGGTGSARYWGGDNTNALDDWDLFGDQAYGNSFTYTFNNPGLYFIRIHPWDAVCTYNWASYADVQIEVSPVNAASIGADQTICTGSTPASLTGGAPSFGALASFTYQWQQSIDNGVTWANATGTSTNSTYAPPALTQTTLYKRNVLSNSCASTSGELVTWSWTTGSPISTGLPNASNYNRVWTINNSIKKAITSWGGIDGWGTNAGAAISTQTITNNGGYVEAIMEHTNRYGMLGLGNYDITEDYSSIEFAIYPSADGNLYVFESGVQKGGSYGTYAIGDKVIVALENNQIKYYKNTSLLYTSALTPTLPLYVDASIYTQGGGFKLVKILNPVKVVVNPNPTTANAGTDQSICNNTTATLAGNVPAFGTGAWSLISGTATITTPGSPTSGVTGLVVGSSATLRWTISNSPCTPSADDVIITSYSLPTTSNAGPDQTLCNVTTATLAGNVPAPNSGVWSVISGTAIVTTPTSQTSGVTGLVVGASATLRWTITNGGCTSIDDVVINVNALPSTPSASANPNPICTGGTSTLTVTGGTLGGPASISGGLVAYYPFYSDVNDYSGNGLNLAGAGGSFTNGGIQLTTASSYASASTSVLNTDNYTMAFYIKYTAAPDASWRKIFGYEPAGTDRSPGLWKYPGSMQMHWRHDPGNTGLAEAQVYTLNQWYYVVGVKNGATLSIYVDGSLVESGAVANPKTAGSAPLWFGGAPVVLREFKIFNRSFAASDVTALGQWKWYTGSCTGTLVGAGPTLTVTPGSTTTYYVKGTGSCGNSACGTTVVTVNSAPSASNAGSPQTICTTGSATLAANNPATGVGAWTVSSGPSTSSAQFNNTTLFNAVFTPSGGAGSYVLTWTISNSPCTASSSNVTITVSPPPTASNAGTPQSICTTGSATLAANNPAIGTGAWTVFSGPSTSSAQFNNTTLFNAIFTPAGGAGSYVLRWTISNAPCTASSSNVTITVDIPPVQGGVSDVGPIDFCSATGDWSAIPISIAGSTGTVWWQYGWSSGGWSADWVSGISPGYCCFPKKVAVSDGNPDRVRWYVKSATGGCAATAYSAPILLRNHYNEDPSSLSSNINNICSGTAGTLTATFPTVTNILGTVEFATSCGGAAFATIAGNGTTTVATAFTAPATTTTYYARYNPGIGTGCAPGSCVSVTVIVLPPAPATPGAISGISSQCPNVTGQTYSITPVVNATTYTWAVPVGWSITAGAGTATITVTTGAFGQNGNITVSAGNSCGTSATSVFGVTTNGCLPAPTQLVFPTNGNFYVSLSNNTYLVMGNSNTNAFVNAGVSGGFNKWVISEGETNYVQWDNVVAGTYIVPFGYSSSAYLPFTFTKTSGGASNLVVSSWATPSNNQIAGAWCGATNVGAVTTMNDPTTGGDGSIPAVIDRWWTIYTTATANLTFSYRGAENTTTYAPTGSFSAQHWNGTSWDSPVGSGTGVTSGVGTVTVTGASTFSPWILSSTLAPLPVQWLEISARCNSGDILVKWSTASEQNASHFTVERSTDGINFSSVATVLAAGNSSTINNYSSLDTDPYSGTSFYRIRQTDFNGNFMTTDILVVNGCSNDDVIIYGNGNNVAVIIDAEVDDEYFIEIRDLLGQKLMSELKYVKAGTNYIKLSPGTISSAIYVVMVYNNNNSVTKKVFLRSTE